LVVSTTVMNSFRLENDVLSPSKSAINRRTWYIQITKKNSVTNAIQPISPRDLIADQMPATEIGWPASGSKLIPVRHPILASSRRTPGPILRDRCCWKRRVTGSSQRAKACGYGPLLSQGRRQDSPPRP